MADLRDVLEIALRAGQLLLENGAETWRLEETVHRLGTALGAEWMDIYPTPTGIIISTVAAGEHRTRIRRVTNLGVDLSRVGEVLALSRRVAAGGVTRGEVRTELERIARAPRLYPAWLTVVMVALACASFSALSGARVTEFVLGMLAAAVTVLTRNGLNRFFGRPVLLTFTLSAFFGTAAALAGTRLLPIRTTDLVVVASIISLLPGVPMINSIADLINANYVSGLVRGAQAVLALAAVATGTVLGLALWGAPGF
jgi:uncharacterized membrane protein YjjP (DUF1212 family)